MRIRSIKPEFWTSEDIASLDWPTRLLFIGLWSYVDDNGVGRDVEKLIKADLFPLEDDPRDTLATVSRGLQALSDAGLITRYTVAGKPFLHIATWEKHQRIDRPAKPRYPLPTCDDASIRDTLATVSRHPRDSAATGTGEQGNRGTDITSAADAPDMFAEFYDLYPRKEGRGQAAKAWKAALKKAGAADIIAGLSARLPLWVDTERKFIPLPATWLNGERWADDLVRADPEPGQSEWATLPTVEDLQARRGWEPDCPECERPDGLHFKGCSKAAQ